MPRPLPVITVKTAPLEVLDEGNAQHYVRATELLRLARGRRDARKLAEAQTSKQENPLRANAEGFLTT